MANSPLGVTVGRPEPISNDIGLELAGLENEQRRDARDDSRFAQELTPLFNALDRVFTMMRVYPPTHPLVGELVDNVMRRFEPLLEREGSLFFNLDAESLQTLDGTPFFSEKLSEKDQYIWYAPYSDGVLQVELEAGLDAEELRAFLRVVDRAAQGTISSDDDTVTLLWELQSDHIRYFAVEGFVDSGELEEFGERTEKEAVQLIVDAAIDPRSDDANELGRLFDNLTLTHLDLFTRMQIEANARIIVPELRDQDLAYAFAIDDRLVDRLTDEWGAGADLEYRLIETLLSTIRTSPASEGAKRAGEMITSITRQLIDHESFEEAVRILELLRDRRALFFDTKLDPLGELIEELAEPAQIEGLLNIFQVKVELRDSLERLFVLLGGSRVLTQVLALLADPKRKVVALAQLIDIVFALAVDDNEPLVTSARWIEQPIYLRRLMSELPSRDFVSWKPTPRLIRKAIDCPDPEVRELALQLKHPCWDDPNLAEKYLVPMSNDQDETIRKLALALLGDRHTALFQDAIQDTILARKMGGRTHAELRFLMRIFLDSSTEARSFLRQLLDVRGWFGSDKKEFAKMAAAILVEAKDAEAIEKIQKMQDSVLTSPDLKQAYAQILERFGGDAHEEPAEEEEG